MVGGSKRLADFILDDMEVIVAEWEAFAATLLPAAAGMTQLALRDHALQILEAVAADLRTPQTRHQQTEKSKGRAPAVPGASETAAQTHAVLRARSGFNINQLVAEYRALRASVLRLWLDAVPLEAEAIQDIIRFNEAIDQAIAESVGHFDEQVTQARNLLLGTLGHDMRNPLNNVLMTAQHLVMLNAGENVSVAARRLIASGASMQALLDDLLDFSRTNLGLGLSVVPTDIDLADPVRDELDQLRGTHPDRVLEVTFSGDLRGRWDRHRVQQLLRNLVLNAVEHGAPDAPVRVVLRGANADVILEVANRGGPQDVDELTEMFDPLRRGVALNERDSGNNLGLGLFIVREIARAHGGEVEVRCADGETVFAVRLPRESRVQLPLRKAD